MDRSRITLRPFKLSDADDFLKYAGDDRATQYMRWNSMTSREGALTHLETVTIPHPSSRSICLGDRSKANAAYALAAEYWGQGIVTATLRMAPSAIFKDLPEVMRLQALVEVDNRGSQRVLEKVGFLKEGLLRKYGYNKGEIRDLVVYYFLSADKTVVE
ncbi:Uncharacterized N-acetyltransferase YoaA [Linum grandiflorum]